MNISRFISLSGGQLEASRIIGVSVSTISRWASGKIKPKSLAAKKRLLELGLTVGGK